MNTASWLRQLPGRKRREKYIQEVSSIISEKLASYGLVGKVSGRPKHFFSIFRKMKAQNLEFEQVYDVIAFRIILATIKDCYEALGIIHSLWKPVPGRFKDYIAMPKANGYQSLHTTVIGPYGERVEIQIRTEEMNRTAEEGIAAHWQYKEGKVFDPKDTKQFAWVRQLLEWQQDLRDPREFLETVKIDLFPDEVYVFTPHGDVKQFPIGATPVDFAYSIHTRNRPSMRGSQGKRKDCSFAIPDEKRGYDRDHYRPQPSPQQGLVEIRQDLPGSNQNTPMG